MHPEQFRTEYHARVVSRGLLAAIVVGAAVLCTAEVGSAAEQAPIATQEIVPGVTLEILKLRRINDRVVQLDAAVNNQRTKDLNLRDLGLIHSSQETDGIVLLDYENSRSYDVGDRGVDCLCSQLNGDTLIAGDRFEFWAQFRAPPADVSKVAVQVGGAPPLFDVPVTE